MLGKSGLKFSTVLLDYGSDFILHCLGIHCVPISLGGTSVKQTAEILVFGAICKLCFWYLTVETAVGGEIGNFPGICNATKIPLSFSRPKQ